MSAVLNDEKFGESELLEKLASALARHFKPTFAVPVEIDLWDVAMVAAFLKRDPAVVRERITVLPDFPKAIRLPSRQGRAHPLYKAAEVIQWAETYREKR